MTVWNGKEYPLRSVLFPPLELEFEWRFLIHCISYICVGCMYNWVQIWLSVIPSSAHRKCHIFLAWAIQARFDHILGVVVPGGGLFFQNGRKFDLGLNISPCVKVHVSQTVVDAKVLDVEEVVIRVEVSTILVSWLLCVTKLVVNAKLEHLNKKNIIGALTKTKQNCQKGNWVWLHLNEDQLKSLSHINIEYQLDEGSWNENK